MAVHLIHRDIPLGTFNSAIMNSTELKIFQSKLLNHTKLPFMGLLSWSSQWWDHSQHFCVMSKYTISYFPALNSNDWKFKVRRGTAFYLWSEIAISLCSQQLLNLFSTTMHSCVFHSLGCLDILAYESHIVWWRWNLYHLKVKLSVYQSSKSFAFRRTGVWYDELAIQTSRWIGSPDLWKLGNMEMADLGFRNDWISCGPILRDS